MLSKAAVIERILSEGVFVTVMEAGHVWAQSHGGPDILENLTPLCAVCIDVVVESFLALSM